MSTYRGQQRGYIGAPSQESISRSISTASTRNSVNASGSTQPYNQEMSSNFVQQPQRPASNSGVIQSSRISTGPQRPRRSSRRRRPDGRQPVLGVTNTQRLQQRAVGQFPGFEPAEDKENRIFRREQERLGRRLGNNNGPRAYQVLSPISIIHSRPEARSQDACLAMFCRTLQYSLVHPRKLRLLGIIPQDLPPIHLGEFRYPHGIADPRTFTELIIEHRLLDIAARPANFLVLPDDAIYHEVDVYLGQPFLDQYFGGNLPNTLFPGFYGDRVAVHRQAESSRGLRAVPTIDDNFIPITVSSASSQYFPREFSTPITPSSRTSNYVGSIAPLIGSQNQWQTYQDYQVDPHVATISTTGVSALPAYPHGPTVRYTPQGQNELADQYIYPCPPEAAYNNPTDPGNYLQVPESSTMGSYPDITSGSASPAPNNSITWPSHSPGAQFN